MINASRDMILQVREFLERHCNAIEIASRMNIDVEDVQTIIEIIKGIAT